MPVVLHAPAKLTLSLRITGVRDDGFHLIDAEMVSVDLYDVLHIEELHDPAAGGQQSAPVLTVVRDGVSCPGDADDLVVEAVALTGRRASVVLHKTIPAGAGLGGGSSDAAAVLRWAGITDPVAAAGIGADVAFCVVGGRARVGGIGEVVEPLEHESRTFTLFTPDLHCSTPVVYRRWDDLGGPTGEWGNDLEPAATSAYPDLVTWRDEVARLTGRRPRLAGSGSTWFVEGSFDGLGGVVVNTVPAVPP